MTVTTTLERADGSAPISHTGTSGFTVTGQREGDNLEVLIEIGIDIEPDEAIALIGTFLAQIEELQSEAFVARCLGHYAHETGKKFMDAGDHQLVMIRGNKHRRR